MTWWDWLNDRFAAFAAACQRAIASPLHFVLFLVATAIWLIWAITRHFDPFSQLVANTPTTLAEYVFEILVLAAALAAERKAHATERKADQLLEEMRTLVRAIAADQSQLLAESRVLEDAEREELARLARIEQELTARPPEEHHDEGSAELAPRP